MLMDMGMTRDTPTKATEEIHRDENRAPNFHLMQELGVDPRRSRRRGSRRDHRS